MRGHAGDFAADPDLSQLWGLGQGLFDIAGKAFDR